MRPSAFLLYPGSCGFEGILSRITSWQSQSVEQWQSFIYGKKYLIAWLEFHNCLIFVLDKIPSCTYNKESLSNTYLRTTSNLSSSSNVLLVFVHYGNSGIG